MHGKVIQFKADIANFKVKDGVVTIQLAADTADIVLDKLNEISSGPLMVNLEAVKQNCFQIMKKVKILMLTINRWYFNG